MKKLLFTAIIFLFTVTIASAAPFIRCTPYAITGAEPTSFVLTLNGTAYPVLATPTGTNQVWFEFDLAGKFVTGQNTIIVKAINMWGESANSPPFDFTAGIPAVPSGIALSAD